MRVFRYLFSMLCITTLLLHGIEISNNSQEQILLPSATLYIDDTQTLSIDKIQNKKFIPIYEEQIGFGYAPDFNVWIKLELTNPYNQKIKKVLEYTNPLTAFLALYNAKTQNLLYKGGISASSVLKSINPTFPVTLEAHETKVYYLKAYSSVTTLIVGLSLWDVDDFYQKESKYQFILALFFGAMGIIIFYNLFIYFSVREKVYLYYVLAFAGIIFHHLFYRGLAGLYFLSPSETMGVVKYATFIVAIPTFFLTLFTKDMLKLEQYPKLNFFLSSYLLIFTICTIFCYIFDLNNLRNLFSVILLVILFSITMYALLHQNRQAKLIMLGWVALLSSGSLMYLSSIGIYDIFQTFPYYVELALLVETLLFSLILADRLKELRLEKISSQEKFIRYQADEEDRLTELVAKKTSQLQVSVKEKDLLLQELNHRVKNSIQTIVSFLRLQIDETENEDMQQTLIHIENRILSISHLYSLLYAKHDISYINAYEYFSLLIENIQNTLHKEEITVKLNTDVALHSEVAVYCGFIINEAVTNALQHAFKENEEGIITITLTSIGKIYLLTVIDDGKGFDISIEYSSLGLTIIESLATYQLHGTLSIESKQGTELIITWEEKDE